MTKALFIPAYAPRLPVKWTIGKGSPEGAVKGDPGDMWTNIAGGKNTTLYVKETGTGTATGWAAK